MAAKEVKLKYIPTGIVFTMPKEDAIEIMKTDRGNYEAIGFKFPKEKEVVETTTYEQVVEEEAQPEAVPEQIEETVQVIDQVEEETVQVTEQVVEEE